MKKSTRKIFFLLSLSCTLWILALLIEKYAKRKADNSELALDFESRLHDSEKELALIFDNKVFIEKAINKKLDVDTVNFYEQKTYTFLIFGENDSLLYWNNNRVQPYKSDCQYETNSTQKLNEIAGSKYLLIKRPFESKITGKSKRYSIVGLIPLYLRFPINNQYLFS